MTDEADRKRKLVKEINLLPGAYARRIEDKWAVGVLDLVIKLPGQPWLWAEGKIIDGNLFAPSERQWVEGNRIRATGTLVLLFGWKQRFMFISPWVQQADIRTCFYGSGQWAPLLIEYLKGTK
jgi:hypothetical protein